MRTFYFYYFDQNIELVIGMKTCKEPRRTSYWRTLNSMKNNGLTEVIGFKMLKN